MTKNIILCCDGTGNEFGDSNSNVVKLYQTLVQNEREQVTYYHPGVGTMGAKNALTSIGKTWTKVRGLAFGYGLSENIADAYRCLMHAFEPGDRVFIFGFSRGAYTARALCGMLRMFGLLSPGNEGLIPYAMRLFKRADGGLLARFKARRSKFQTAAQFKQTFCVPCKPHFLGAWDTVSSVGWILDPIGLKPGRLPYTTDLEDVAIVRHAVSIDERRAFFRQNLVSEKGRDVKQVWFAGVHSDVGGSYSEAESGLSKISLSWMMAEAKIAGLKLNNGAVDEMLGGHPRRVRPSPYALQHNSLKPSWWLGEIWPKWTKRRVSPPGQEPVEFKGSPRVNVFRRRYMADGACVHESVCTRMQAIPDYRPSNLPERYTVEPDPQRSAYPMRLGPGHQVTVGIHAEAKWNDTALRVERNETYRFEASGKWFDANYEAGPSGYRSPSLLFKLAERLRRVSRANWFALIGALDRRSATAFAIGEHLDWTVSSEGTLYCFANDLPFMYRNNSGWVRLTITRLK